MKLKYKSSQNSIWGINKHLYLSCVKSPKYGKNPLKFWWAVNPGRNIEFTVEVNLCIRTISLNLVRVVKHSNKEIKFFSFTHKKGEIIIIF